MSEWSFLPNSVLRRVGTLAEDAVTEIRLRAGQPIEVCSPGASRLSGDCLSAAEVRSAVDEMAHRSLYAWEEELKQGFFTLENGCRVGIGGRFVIRNGQIEGISHISSVAVRIAREKKGCADALLPMLCPQRRPVGALILSPPGLGKTTLLREIARCLSGGSAGIRACRVGIADERGELAACHGGVPTLDVGPRTDVYEACPKHLAIPLMIRALGCEVVVTDELGTARDAECVLDALRCGVRVMASAHAENLDAALRRPMLRELLNAHAFGAVVELGSGVGEIRRVIRC